MLARLMLDAVADWRAPTDDSAHVAAEHNHWFQVQGSVLSTLLPLKLPRAHSTTLNYPHMTGHVIVPLL
jgi:hypothetical protein